MSVFSTSTVSVGPRQRSQPMWPPWRSVPETSRASSDWPSGSQRATRVINVASESAWPAHHQALPNATTNTSSKVAKKPASARQARCQRLRFARAAAAGPGAELGEEEGDAVGSAMDQKVKPRRKCRRRRWDWTP
ncbi:hypothetical protein D3C78_1582930 [compost metagenome]